MANHTTDQLSCGVDVAPSSVDYPSSNGARMLMSGKSSLRGVKGQTLNGDRVMLTRMP
ncbi:unnamed protein product [Protopolystoma xenopodis]|uniref:Uncharacterized protein n=1 Tax=Protopolystoma xenopodis TaxID=117903 RepID=A0A448WWS1_9PLAT|nr:unnamed protein product [Protopolystoma xenopodis]